MLKFCLNDFSYLGGGWSYEEMCAPTDVQLVHSNLDFSREIQMLNLKLEYSVANFIVI